jgi:polar amino acid transport system permease protein
MTTTEGHPPDEIRAVPLRHPWRWVASAALLVLAAMLVHDLITNPNFGWSNTKQYFFSQPILQGVVVTLELTALAMLIGIVLGVILAVMRLSPNRLVSWVSWLYIWFFRGTPVFVQVLFWYNIAYLFRHGSGQPVIGFGVPFGPQFAHLDINSVVTPLVAGTLALGLNEAAYYAEIVRAGILSVAHGQTEAAQSLGMRRLQIMRKIVLPQAMRVIIPPTGNETISMLKTSSLASVATVPELLYETQQIYARTYATVPMLIMVSLWYLLLTTILTIGQYYLERHFARGSVRALPPTPFQQLKRNLTTWRIPFVPPPIPVEGGGRRAAT